MLTTNYSPACTPVFFAGGLLYNIQPMSNTIEVFRTNVNHPHEAEILLQKLREAFNHCEPSFDLEDCDRVLRLADRTGKTTSAQVIGLLAAHGFKAEVMED